MYVWIQGAEKGDIKEPSYILNVTEINFRTFMDSEVDIENTDVMTRKKQDLYKLLVIGGETFNFETSSVVKEDEEFRFVFTDKNELFYFGRFKVRSILNAISI
jgi:uncharacterized protein YfaT (DUF1175 family)